MEFPLVGILEGVFFNRKNCTYYISISGCLRPNSVVISVLQTRNTQYVCFTLKLFSYAIYYFFLFLNVIKTKNAFLFCGVFYFIEKNVENQTIFKI